MKFKVEIVAYTLMSCIVSILTLSTFQMILRFYAVVKVPNFEECNQERNQNFAKGGDLKMENFYDVILMTYFRRRNLMTSPK